MKVRPGTQALKAGHPLLVSKVLPHIIHSKGAVKQNSLKLHFVNLRYEFNFIFSRRNSSKPDLKIGNKLMKKEEKYN